MRRAAVLTVTLAIFSAGTSSAEASIDWKQEHWDGSRTTPVHNFAMYDETGQQIVPEYDRAMPMSSRNTCGTCHTYSVVSSGWHFNSSKGVVSPGRPGEPWVIVDKQTGTQLPVSYRGWPGMWDPEALGMSQWDFTNRFARHMPGGDFAEPEGEIPEDPHARWEISGKLEVNCLACHNGSTAQDHSEWALQTERENFRWAATAAAHLGDVNGMASRMRESWIIGDGPNPDDSEFAVAPSVDYHEYKFDDKNRTIFDVRHKPPDQNCLQCHSASPVTTTRWAVSEDVHSALGIGCADCHRNGLDHMIIRGYETEAKERNDPHVGEFSCSGCHIGNAAGIATKGGRLGGPIAEHPGLPPVHFEKMECTACHSGPLPDENLTRVRLSRANRLGIHGRAKWFTEAPYIVEPVFVRGESGKIAPHRMMWPAFWAKMEGEKLKPLLPEEVADAGTGILDVEQQIEKVLQAIAQDADAEGTAVLVLKNRVFWTSRDGGLSFNNYETSAPVAIMWGRQTTDTVAQLVTAFDPAVEELDGEVQEQMQRTLELLARGTVPGATPAFHNGNKLYHLDETGSLVTTQTATIADSLQMVKVVDGEPHPLVPLERAFSFAETAGTEFTLDEPTVVAMLQRLTSLSNDQTQYAYVGNGRAFKLNGEKLEPFDHDTAKPVSWAFGHDVRPAAQSLGIKSCAECHSDEAAYLFADVLPTGPLKTIASVATPMHEFQKLDGKFQELFGLSFKARSAFKVAMYVIVGVLAMVLLVFALVGLRRLTKYVSARN